MTRSFLSSPGKQKAASVALRQFVMSSNTITTSGCRLRFNLFSFSAMSPNPSSVLGYSDELTSLRDAARRSVAGGLTLSLHAGEVGRTKIKTENKHTHIQHAV